jgi:hypothetical protein
MDSLRAAGSWCGETHVQKAAYLLKEFCDVPLPQKFVLYKHGPYSFDLSKDLGAMFAYSLIELELKGRYGPTIIPTDAGRKLMRENKVVPGLKRKADFVAAKFGTQGVADLERLATAYFITSRASQRIRKDVARRAAQLVKIKPHVTLRDATAAVVEIDSWIADAA